VTNLLVYIFLKAKSPCKTSVFMLAICLEDS